MKLFKSFSLIAVVAAALFLFPAIIDSAGYLHQKLFFFLSDPPENSKLAFDLKESRRSGGGEYVLPRHVQMIIGLLRKYQASSFRISPEVQKDAETTQRLIEGGYPIVSSQDAHFLVHLDKETVSRDCKPISSMNGFALAYCP
jgi:hypothetical protein